jgi:hypothetical protein
MKQLGAYQQESKHTNPINEFDNIAVAQHVL